MNFRLNKPLNILYLASFLFAIHLALTSFVNSSFLGQHINSSTVGILFTIGSVLAILALLQMPRILNRFGEYKTILTLVSLGGLSLFGLATISSPNLLIAIFVIYFAVNSLIFFSLDILIENYSDDETTGGTRGLFLTSMNIAWVLSPMIAGFIIVKMGFTGIYIVSLLAMVPLFFLLFNKFKKYKDPEYVHAPFKKTFLRLIENKNILKVFHANFTLQFFYSWMVIYTPIYLNQVIGFPWDKIGIIFTIMLIPFVILEIPLGRIADKWLGEKELMTAGFIIMTLATGTIAFIGAPKLLLWALILFTTRIGASMVEIMTETYFFKQVDGEDVDLISFFRNASPLAYIIAPLLATVFLLIFPFKSLFIALAIIVALGLISSLTLKDTQ
ncbi:hypothetical protein COB64_02295 [Candidatus Wolfebacteria bacterium]|nr:MAG: hypothetical protein COB64_02295 [Candidatus Wolfebacteria bacterium]